MNSHTYQGLHKQLLHHFARDSSIPAYHYPIVFFISLLFYPRSEEHTSELQSRGHLVCRLLLPPPPPSTLFPYTTLFRSPSACSMVTAISTVGVVDNPKSIT